METSCYKQQNNLIEEWFECFVFCLIFASIVELQMSNEICEISDRNGDSKYPLTTWFFVFTVNKIVHIEGPFSRVRGGGGW